MKIENIQKLRCPQTKSKLNLIDIVRQENNDIIEAKLINDSNCTYEIKNGIPDFITEKDMIGDAKFARNYYAGIANTYDDNVDITFKLYKENEQEVRTKMTNLLDLKPNFKVLEISSGTGKDSEFIIKKLSKQGELFCLDISPDMLGQAKDKIIKADALVELICGNAISLPFEDNYFDALFCFAGVGHFSDLPKGLKEMARVVKTGGKVVFSEKNVPEWLRNTEYGKICINNNPMFADIAPLKHMPVEARDLCIRWINGNVHYVVDYVVGDGEPKGNFDMELPGARGGTFNTRFFGKLEGVSPETKKIALQARESLGISMHKWLDELIKKEAKKILNDK